MCVGLTQQIVTHLKNTCPWFRWFYSGGVWSSFCVLWCDKWARRLYPANEQGCPAKDTNKICQFPSEWRMISWSLPGEVEKQVLFKNLCNLPAVCLLRIRTVWEDNPFFLLSDCMQDFLKTHFISLVILK